MPFATPILKMLPLLPEPQPNPGEATCPGPGGGVRLSLEPTGLCAAQSAWGTHIPGGADAWAVSGCQGCS